MSVPTVPVTVKLASLANVPHVGVTVRAKLDINERYLGFVIADEASAVTDATGTAVLNLFPNAPAPTGLGTQGSSYRFRASIPGAKSLDVTARVPNIACQLDVIADIENVTIDAAQAALLQVQALVAQAAVTAAASAASAGGAATSAASAAASRAAIDNRIYPGIQGAVPTTRPDGSAIQLGDEYTDATYRWVRRTVGGVGTWVNFEASAAASATAAATSQAAAAGSATAAALSKTGADSARDAALIQAGVYVDEPTGRAAVADGVAFKVQGSGDVAALEYRRVNAGTVATLIASYPSSALVKKNKDQVFPYVFGFTTGVTGSVATSGGYYFRPETLSTAPQRLTLLSIGMDRISTAEIVVCSVSGTTLTLVSATTVPTVVGVNNIPVDIEVPAGCVVGVMATGNYYTPGAADTMWSLATRPTTAGSTYSTLTFPLNYNLTLSGEVRSRALAGYSDSQTLKSQVGNQYAMGWSSPVIGTGGNSDLNTTWVYGVPAAVASFMTQLQAGFSASGTAEVIVMTRGNSSTNFNLVSRTVVSVTAGVNTIPVGIEVPAGGFIGIYSTNTAILFAATNPDGIGGFKVTGVPSTNTEQVGAVAFRFEMQFALSSGLFAVAGRASAAGTSDLSGLRALASADNTGVADATTIISGALAAFPYPYLPPGKFSATTIQKFGRGLYGPGRLYVGGTRYFAPRRPTDKALLPELRGALADIIRNNDVLTAIGDSITHYVGASAANTHWWELLTQFANFGVAADKPTMTALVNSNGTYTPDFYGVTLGGSVSNGSGGPLNESLVLAAGASMTFVGAYEQVDVFYKQTSGAGSLVFAYGGTTFKTVNAAGTLQLDKFSGPTLTGQAASGTYTITATGGPVEVTGLVRLGVLAAGRLRLRTSRCAHGGYQFGNFGAAAIASIVAQGTYAGGKCAPVLVLGTNDVLNQTAATVEANARTVINALVAAGVTPRLALPPFATGFEDGTYRLRRLYREFGIKVVETDAVDFSNSGLTTDGLHPNDSGNDLVAQMVIERLTAI